MIRRHEKYRNDPARFLSVPGTLFFLALLLFYPAGASAVSHFNDIDDQSIHPGEGTVSFRVRFHRDVSGDNTNHVFLLGTSSDSEESYSIQIIQDKVIARRQFAGCVLTAFSLTLRPELERWVPVRFTWNGASTGFTVDGTAAEKIGPRSSDDLPRLVPCIRLGKDEAFDIDGFSSTAGSEIREDPADAEFVKNVACPRLSELLERDGQETYRGVTLRNFPDESLRDRIKSYLDLLPDDFVSAIHNVVFVDEERASGRGQAGMTDHESGSIMLEAKYASEPTVFFHEAAHLYDAKLCVVTGVPQEQSEWVAISGSRCYFKGADMKKYYEEFQKTHVENGILGGQGGQCPPEDLAEWVGAVYTRYLQGKTFADMLDPASKTYSDKNRKKLDFLLSKGFFSRAVYDKVTADS